MSEITHAQLAAWADFYVIVGSAGAALIGVQFIVITLIASQRTRADAETVGAFGTPTVVHFGAALSVCATMSAPWPSLLVPSVMLGITGVAGLVYGGVVVGRARRQAEYEPVWADWLWFVLLPSAMYAALALAGFFLQSATVTDLFAVGAAALGLLLIGIHNAWDSVTHIVLQGAPGRMDD